MLRIPLIIFIFLSINFSSKAQFTESKIYSFDNHQVVKWKVGDSLKLIDKKLPKEWEIRIDSLEYGEGYEEYYKTFCIYLNNHLLVTIDPDWDKEVIDRFFIHSSLLHSKNGFKIGMTVKEFKNRYTIDKVLYEPDIGIILLVKGFSGSFKIFSTSYDGDPSKLTKNNIPNNLIISEIVIC